MTQTSRLSPASWQQHELSERPRKTSDQDDPHTATLRTIMASHFHPGIAAPEAAGINAEPLEPPADAMLLLWPLTVLFNTSHSHPADPPVPLDAEAAPLVYVPARRVAPATALAVGVLTKLQPPASVVPHSASSALDPPDTAMPPPSTDPSQLNTLACTCEEADRGLAEAAIHALIDFRAALEPLGRRLALRVRPLPLPPDDQAHTRLAASPCTQPRLLGAVSPRTRPACLASPRGVSPHKPSPPVPHCVSMHFFFNRGRVRVTRPCHLRATGCNPRANRPTRQPRGFVQSRMARL